MMCLGFWASGFTVYEANIALAFRLSRPPPLFLAFDHSAVRSGFRIEGVGGFTVLRVGLQGETTTTRYSSRGDSSCPAMSG